jgi:ribosomal protein S18 acetylase RimI-like enzyme
MHLVSPNNPRMPLTRNGHEPIHALDKRHKEEVLSFLAARPLQTFVMSSMISGNGLESSLNRGTFYGYRNPKGQLEGVALIGHITLFESQTDSALAEFAKLTQTCPSVHAVLGEENRISRFMSYYSKGGRQPRLICRELLMEKRIPENLNLMQSLRRARSEELELVVPVHAQSAFEEGGINPLDVDPAGFRQRCARRIKQGKVWVAVERGSLKFKADIVSETPDVVYLEGVFVSAEHRGNGYGARCMTQLVNHLLEHTKSVCLLVNEQNSAAPACYRKAGFKFREYYDTLYLQPQP